MEVSLLFVVEISANLEQVISVEWSRYCNNVFIVFSKDRQRKNRQKYKQRQIGEEMLQLVADATPEVIFGGHLLCVKVTVMSFPAVNEQHAGQKVGERGTDGRAC